MLVPYQMQQETYSLNASFINYVAPMALLLLYLLLLRPLFSGERVRDTALTTALCLPLGFSVSLFSEGITVYALAMAFGVCVWHLLATRRVSFCTVSFLVGALVGTVLLFAAPKAFLSAQPSGEAYRNLPMSFSALLGILQYNYPIIAGYTLTALPVVQLLVSGASIVILLRADLSERPRLLRLRRALLVLLALLPVYFYLTTRPYDHYAMEASPILDTLQRVLQNPYIPILLDLLCYGLYAASAACVLLFFGENASHRRLGVFCICSALAGAAPLFFVQPVGPRCCYISYLFWMLAAALLMTEAVDRIAPRPDRRKLLSLVASGAMVAVCAVNLAVYCSCPRTERIRTAYIERQMRAGAHEIVLPRYDCFQYLYLPERLIGEYYYYDTPNDIAFGHMYYDEWMESFGNQ